MDEGLRAVAHRGEHVGHDAQQPQQVALGPALPLGPQALQVLGARRHQIGAFRIDPEDQEVPEVLGQPLRQVARVESLRETLVKGVERCLGVAPHDRIGEREEDLAVGDPEDAPHQLLVDRGLARGHHLVERADGVADRSLGFVRDEERGSLGEREAASLGVGLLAPRDVHQPGRHLAGWHAREVEALAARADGLGQLLRVGGREDEHQVGRRLLEGLEEGRKSVVRELVHFVDDHHPPPSAGGREAHLLAQRLDVGDAAVRGAVDLGDVERHPGRDLDTARAGVARIGAGRARGPLPAGCGCAAPLAVQGLGEDPRRGGLAHPPGPGKQVGVGHPPALDGPREHASHVLLADHVGEHLRPVLERQRAMCHEPMKRARLNSGTPEALLTAATFRS